MSVSADLFPEIAQICITDSAINTHREQHVSIIGASNSVSVAALGIDSDGCDDEIWWASFSPSRARSFAAELLRAADMAESTP